MNFPFVWCRLSVCVSEAAWRLQLFTDTEFTQQIGHVPVLEHISTISNAQDDWLYLSEESDSEDEKESGGPAPSSSRTQKAASKRSKSETEKSSESGSQSNKSVGWY
jgi:hypothetical protein